MLSAARSAESKHLPSAQAESRPRKLPRFVYYLVLISITMAWGGNFVVSKGIVSNLHPTWVICIRFVIAGVLLFVFMWPHIRKHLSWGLVKAAAIMGFFTFLGNWVQFLGLSGTTPAKNAFLSVCYCVFVPFVWWLIARRKPSASNLLAGVVCLCGMAFISLKGNLSVTWGDGVSILSAIAYSFEIAVVALIIKDHDVITISAVEMIFAGIFAGILGLVSNTPFNAEAFTDGNFLMRMVYLVVLATCYAYTGQNLAQKHVPPAQASLIFAFEGVFGTIFSVIFGYEAMAPKLLVGFALVFAANVISELGNGTKSDSA